jgi:hypothetical protein
LDFKLRTGAWSSLFGLPVSGPAQAFAGELDPVSVVNEPVQVRWPRI